MAPEVRRRRVEPPARRNRGALWFTAFAVLGFLRYGNGVFIKADSAGFFAYLPALVFDGHLNFLEFFRACGCEPASVTPTGLATNFWSLGVSVLWFPFFMSAVVLFKVMGTPLAPYCRYPVFFMTNSGTYLYGLISILLAAGILSKMDFKRSRWTVLIPAVLGTPFFFYMTFGAAMAHVPAVVSICAFAWLCLHRRETDPTPWHLFLLGLVGGLMVSIRAENAIFSILLLLRARWFTRRLERHDYAALARAAGVFLLGGLVTFAPQLVVWNKLYGSFLALPKAQNVSMSRFVLHEILFSPYHGLLFWNPVMLLSILGYLAVRWHPKGRVVALFGCCFLMQILLCSFLESWWSWYSFGNRILTSAFLPVVIGLSCPLGVLRSGAAKRALIGAYFLAALWTVGLFVNYDIGRLNIGVITVGKDLLSLQLGLIKDPAASLGAALRFHRIFWPGFLFYSCLGVASLLASRWALETKKWSGMKLIAVLITLNGLVFLGLALRAAARTPTRTYSDDEKERTVFSRDDLEYLLFHGRLTEIRYLLKMDRRESAEELFYDTIDRHKGTKVWRMLERQHDRKITPSELHRHLFNAPPRPA